MLQMGHDELFQRISVDLGLNNAFIGLKMSSKLNDLPEHFTPRPELQVIFYEIESFFHQLNQNILLYSNSLMYKMCKSIDNQSFFARMISSFMNQSKI